MARGDPVGQATAAVSSTHAAKLTGYNQLARPAQGLRLFDGYFPCILLKWIFLLIHHGMVDTPGKNILLLSLIDAAQSWHRSGWLCMWLLGQGVSC